MHTCVYAYAQERLGYALYQGYTQLYWRYLYSRLQVHHHATPPRSQAERASNRSHHSRCQAAAASSRTLVR